MRIVHHTGQTVARENLKDQYAPRGGSALSDGARMVSVIARPDEGQLPFPFGADDRVFILSRPKCNYCPPQPDIFIKRNGFTFEHQVAIKPSVTEQRTAYANQIEIFLTEQLARGRKYTARQLEDVYGALHMKRKDLRMALASLVAQGRVTDTPLPKEERVGRRQSYLKPSAYCAETLARLGENALEITTWKTTHWAASIIAPPYREKPGAIMDAPVFSRLSTHRTNLNGAIDETESESELRQPIKNGVDDVKLAEVLENACVGLNVSPAELRDSLTPEDMLDVARDSRLAIQHAEYLARKASEAAP